MLTELLAVTEQALLALLSQGTAAMSENSKQDLAFGTNNINFFFFFLHLFLLSSDMVAKHAKRLKPEMCK